MHNVLFDEAHLRSRLSGGRRSSRAHVMGEGCTLASRVRKFVRKKNWIIIVELGLDT